MPRSRIVVLVGLPGCGKSTWIARNNLPALSSDEIRRLLADDPADQGIHYRVFNAIRYLLRQRLEINRPLTYIDATNLTPRERRAYIRMAELHDCDVDAVFFDVPLEVCMDRNRARARNVPEEAMRKLAARLRPPSTEEGFAQVTVVRE